MKTKVLKDFVIVVIIYLISAIGLYVFNSIYIILGTSKSWIDFANYIAGITTPITALATIYITYLVYHLNDENHKSERYFEKIVNLYFQIQKTYTKLNQNKEGDREVLSNEIKRLVRLTRYYLQRFPDLSHTVMDFDMVLNDIWFEPSNPMYYKSLAFEFDNFCICANQEQKRPVEIK